MKRDIEKRCTPIKFGSGVGEFRAEVKDGRNVIAGYAVVWDSLSVDLGGFVEKINRKAFDRSLASGFDVVSTSNHNPQNLLGRMSNGTLKVTPDDIGLWTETYPPDTSAGRDAIVNVERRDYVGMSFQFFNTPGTDKYTMQDGIRVREVMDADLIELGPVTFPAYQASSVSAETRSAVDALQREDEAEVVAEASATETEASVVEEEHKFDQIAILQKELDIVEIEIDPVRQ